MAFHINLLVHTPEKDGIVDRKSRHLVETTYTLLHGANILVHH